MEITLEQYIRAAHPLVIVETTEPDITLQRIKGIAAKHDRMNSSVKELDITTNVTATIAKILDSKEPPHTIYVVKNIQFILEDSNRKNAFIQALHNVLPGMERAGPYIIIGMCPAAKLPVELERYAVVYSDKLPRKEVLKANAAVLLREFKMTMDEEALDEIADAGNGMTLKEFRDACALSAIATGKLDPAVIKEIKKQLIRKNGMLELFYPDERNSFKYIGGLEVLKKFAVHAAKSTDPRGRGILLVGPPGTGKTVIAQSLAYETGMPMVLWSLARAFGSLVGQTEANIRGGIETIKAFGRCIVFLDKTCRV